MTSYFTGEALDGFTRGLLTSQGLPESDAATVAAGLVSANLRGLDSHGVSRMPMYLERLRRGVVNPRPQLKVERVTPVVARLDGDDGMGFIAGKRGMEEAIAMAKEYGLSLVGIHRSTHYGMAALYPLQAVEAGLIAFAFTNSSPALPVWGGRTTFLGASPLAVGVPGGARGPYVLDMAMTVIARGKIRLAAQRGEPIEPGLALDAEGRPTTDAAAAFEGVCLPFGGIKGSALAMLMDVLGGVLTGAKYAGEVNSLYFDHSAPQNVGHVFIAFRPDLFMPMAEFEARMDTLVERAKACPKAEGVTEILIPGEPEARTDTKRRLAGIPLNTEVRQSLEAEAARYSVPFPEGSAQPLG